MPSRLVRIGCVLAACVVISATTCPADIPSRVPNGNWGGEHMALVVTDSGATIEYDCAAGTITGPLILDGSGNFDWRGVHYPGHGGPSRIDQPPDAHPAHYTGHATSKQLSITLSILDMAVPEQAFTLQRGANARLFKCQ
jgi:hypothetical protein